MDVFFWITGLLIPLITVIMGLVFTYRPPRKINSIYGYRTARSMASQEAWDTAHSISGGVYLRLGLALTLIIIIINLFMPLPMEAVIFIDLGAGLIGVIAPIFYVEKRLKEEFVDKN